MTIAQFRPENSTRAETLYAALKPYLHDGMNMLDVGCAYACLYPLISADFPNTYYLGFDSNGGIIDELQQKYPEQIWEQTLITNEEMLELCDWPSFDVAIHIGVDADWSPIWEIHPWLIENRLPKIVFLEAGRRDGYEDCMMTYEKIKAFYIDAHYKLADTSQFDFDWGGPCLRDRHYSILRK